MRKVALIARYQVGLLRRDPIPLVTLVAMPLLVISFVKPLYKSGLLERGLADANGSELAVPGLTVMFAFFLVGFVGYYFFQEHGWRTWDRLRASQCGPVVLVAGKLAPLLVLAALQFVVLFGLGSVIFDMRIRGSVAGVALTCLALAVCYLSLGVAIISLATTVQQVNTFSSMGAMVFAGVGGALTPVSLLPGWAQAIAPFTPTYWAMRSFKLTVLDGAGLDAVYGPVLVLFGFAVFFGLVAAFRFRVEEEKAYWA